MGGDHGGEGAIRHGLLGREWRDEAESDGLVGGMMTRRAIASWVVR